MVSLPWLTSLPDSWDGLLGAGEGIVEHQEEHLRALGDHGGDGLLGEQDVVEVAGADRPVLDRAVGGLDGRLVGVVGLGGWLPFVAKWGHVPVLETHRQRGSFNGGVGSARASQILDLEIGFSRHTQLRLGARWRVVTAGTALPIQ